MPSGILILGQKKTIAMKKCYLLLTLMGWQANSYSQTLNQSANWPNPAWTITGNYNEDSEAFESDPRTALSFGYNDRFSGNPHEDNIAAESPVINLSAAFANGETLLELTMPYGYRYKANDALRLEYWDAAISAWIPWGENIPGNANTSFAVSNFCSLPKTLYISEMLNISGFTTAQLTGFRYRLFYDDDPAGAAWNYGFCFDSPTLRSWSCAAPTRLTATGVGSSPITWDNVPGIAGYEYVLNTTSADPTGAGTPTLSNIFLPSNLSLPPSTKHFFHVRSVCTASQSPWRTVSFTTSPVNDNCTAAIALTVNPTAVCTVKTAGTLESATDSDEPHVGSGRPDDDVWYTFVATATSHRIELTNITGNGSEIIVHEVLEGTCGGGLISVHLSDPDLNPTSSTPRALTIGNTYYIRVFTYASDANTQTDFDICITTPPPSPANDNCSGAYTLTVNPTATCTAVTAGSLVSATDSNEGNPEIGTPNDDVWFKFTATQTAHRVTLRNVSGMPRDLVVEILQGNCGNLTSMKISTSYANTVFGLTIGNTYYVRVFSESPDTGATTTFNVCLSIPPTGAICEKPIVVSGLPYTTTDNTINYGDDYDFPQGGESGCEGTNNHYLGGDETVYAYTPAANQTINIRIPGAPGWTAILVYTDCNAIGTGAIACANGDFEIGDREINELAVTAGTTYYILLSTQPAPQSFAYTLNITEESLGTKPFDDSSFRAYPNPVKNILNLSYKEEMTAIKVFNILGQQVLSKNINATESEVDMSALHSGTYLVKAYAGEEVRTFKVIKQ